MKRLLVNLLLITMPLMAVASLTATRYENINNIRYASQFAGADIGVQINAAIADFGAAPACGIVYLARGQFNFGTTISITGREGCRLIGQGDGQAASGGTYLTWNGAANGTMLSVAGCIGCDVTGFLLNGNSIAGIGMQYTNGGGVTSQQSSFHDLTVINVTGSPGQAVYVGSATDAQVSESRFDRLFLATFVTGVRQEGANTLNISYSDLSMTASSQSTSCFDIAIGNFRSLHDTCVGIPATGIAAYNISSMVGTVDIVDSYVEASGGPVISSVGTIDQSSNITVIGSNLGSSNTNTNFFNITTNGSLVLLGNSFHGMAATATYGPVGLVADGVTGTLFSKGNTWIGVTLTPSGSAYSVNVDESGVTSPYSSALSRFNSSHSSVIDSTNTQFIKGSLSFYDGTTRYNLFVASAGLMFTDGSGNIIGGWNAGNPAAAASFESTNLDIANLKLRNSGTLKLADSSTAPTIAPATGFNTGTVTTANGTAFFVVTVGSGTANSTGTLSLPTATTGWFCHGDNQTRAALIQQTSNTTTTSVLTNFGTSFAATNWTNGDVINITCRAN